MTVIDRLWLKRQGLPDYTGFSLIQQSPSESFVDPKRTVRRLKKCTSTLLQTQEYCNAADVAVQLCEPVTIDALTRIVAIISDSEAPWNSQGCKMRPASLVDLFGNFYACLNELQHLVKAMEGKSRQSAKSLQPKIEWSAMQVLAALRQVSQVVFRLSYTRATSDDSDCSDSDDEHPAVLRSASLVPSEQGSSVLSMQRSASDTSEFEKQIAEEEHAAIQLLDEDWQLAYLDVQNKEIRSLRSVSWGPDSDSWTTDAESFDDSESAQSSRRVSSDDEGELLEGLAYLTSVTQLQRARTVNISALRTKPQLIQCRSMSSSSVSTRSKLSENEAVPSSPISFVSTVSSSSATMQDLSHLEHYATYLASRDKQADADAWELDDLDEAVLMRIPRGLMSAKRAEYERNFGKTEAMPVFDRFQRATCA